VKPFVPMLATLTHDVPSGPEWVFEEKYDGIRALAIRQRRPTRLYSRSLRDITAEFPEVARAVDALPGSDLVLDGELVALDRHGVSRFQLFQRRGEEGVSLRYAVFDMVERDGRRLFSSPLSDRRAALEKIVAATERILLVSRRLAGRGERAYATAKTKGWEGVIAKNAASTYEPGVRSRDWLKIKVRKESEFVIGGYTPPEGARTHFGALLVGLYDDDGLRYTGKVGTGFTAKTLAELGRKLGSLRADVPPFEPPPRIRDATWVRPTLVAQLAFQEWTGDGKLRQPAFLGLREDKDPRECRWSERDT
jgi:bifunctional non-homologous end joining protein LigD